MKPVMKTHEPFNEYNID